MNVLVDTSVWVDHLRTGEPRLHVLLQQGRVATQEHVLGELMVGHLSRRAGVLAWLSALPRAREPHFEEVRSLVERQELFGRGLSWSGCVILTTALLDRLSLWTKDRPLALAATELEIEFRA